MLDIPSACPYCMCTAVGRRGMTNSGTQRYQCKECKKTFTFTLVGRPSIWGEPMTINERVKRHRIEKRQLAQAKKENTNESPDR